MGKKINFGAISAAYVKGMQGASAAYQGGVLGVTTSPGQLAANKADKWLANLTNSQPKWKNSMQNLPLSSWQNACTAKASRLGTGASAASGKVDRYYSQVGSQIQALKDQINNAKSDPNSTGEDRVKAWMDGMRQISASYNK